MLLLSTKDTKYLRNDRLNVAYRDHYDHITGFMLLMRIT